MTTIEQRAALLRNVLFYLLLAAAFAGFASYVVRPEYRMLMHLADTFNSALRILRP